jgi:DNA-binding beta-propeller fold protein YncE
MRVFLPLALCVACAPPPESASCGDPGVICHVAGTGEQAYNGEGLPAEETALNLPSVARPGPDGLLYVMDFNNMRLRCLMPDGTLRTVAGNGDHAYAIAGADARRSPLENPIDFAFAADGRIVFVALHDPRVLTIDGEGKVGVLAGRGDGDAGDGGYARAALFTELTSLAIAPDGSVFVADGGAHRVRVIRPDGSIHAYAGTGERGDDGDGGPATGARFGRPAQLALDGDGNLYVADMDASRVRRVDAATGRISTIAGTGEAGLSGDGGPATAAQLRWPMGVAVGPGGELYIADTDNHRVRRVDRDGTITTVAGSVRGADGDGGPAVDARLHGPGYLAVAEGELYVADMRNQVVRVITLALE